LLHCHTNYSDGSCTVRELAVACREAGYTYVGITDHSETAAYAGGLTADDVIRQGNEIDEVNASIEGIRILKGIEADILADGQVDYSESILAGLDFVIASVHSRLNMNEAEMTTRILAALDNPYVSILGHPTGRLLLSRNPFPVDLDQVFARAAERGGSDGDQRGPPPARPRLAPGPGSPLPAASPSPSAPMRTASRRFATWTAG
jgi:DNA polymerase (family 10)